MRVSALQKVERRVRTLFDMKHVIGVFIIDPPGATFASMVHPGLKEAQSAGEYVLAYYQKNREAIPMDALRSHQYGKMGIHLMRGQAGAVAVAAGPNANQPALAILAQKLTGDLTAAAMKALTAAASEFEQSPPSEDPKNNTLASDPPKPAKPRSKPSAPTALATKEAAAS